MDTDDLSEKAWALIILAATVSDTLKAELGAMAGRFRSEEEWLLAVRNHLERIARNPEGYVGYWDLENAEAVSAAAIGAIAAELRDRTDSVVSTPINKRGSRSW